MPRWRTRSSCKAKQSLLADACGAASRYESLGPSTTALTRQVSGRSRFCGFRLFRAGSSLERVRSATPSPRPTPAPKKEKPSMYIRLLEAPTMSAISTFKELGHGLVAGPRLLLVVRHLRGLALAAGVHRFAIINPDRLVHAIPILPFPVERSRIMLVFGHLPSFFLPVWKSKFYGAFVLNHRVVLHATDATPAR